MSEQIVLQENEVIERTIEVSVDRNGLGIESGQVFPSVIVDFTPIQAPTDVHWDDIIDKPDFSEKADKVVPAAEGDFASLDANGNLTDSGRSYNAFVVYIGYNPRESDFIYRKGDENGTDEIIISKDALKELILSDVDSFTMFDDNGDAWEVKISTSGELVTERKQYT